MQPPAVALIRGDHRSRPQMPVTSSLAPASSRLASSMIVKRPGLVSGACSNSRTMSSPPEGVGVLAVEGYRHRAPERHLLAVHRTAPVELVDRMGDLVLATGRRT
jgi:hypothetical protein